jgi:hypothetical protein
MISTAAYPLKRCAPAFQVLMKFRIEHENCVVPDACHEKLKGLFAG